MDITLPEDLKHPLTNSSTPVSRKRKHEDTLDFTNSPKFSSTLNDSLITDLKDIRLYNSVPNTPEKQLSCIYPASPIQESRKILYGSIKVVKPERERKLEILRGNDVNCSNQSLWNSILNIDVIMDGIFKYLSGGDLYRFSSVSKPCLRALENNFHACNRYMIYKLNYKDNKENYVITPPGSPEKCDSPPRTNSEIFNKFIRYARRLSNSQTLTKCRKCGGVAIVDNDIGQCQNVNGCGLIYCLICSSFSETGAKDFKDACGHASLRPHLRNVSNQMREGSSLFSSFSNQDSGFHSENETPPKVKKVLFPGSGNGVNVTRALTNNNRNKVAIGVKKKDSISFVPVVVNEGETRVRWRMDESPPSYGYAVCSKQSKKNLKRLTR